MVLTISGFAAYTLFDLIDSRAVRAKFLRAVAPGGE
jgi:hypothetical protein